MVAVLVVGAALGLPAVIPLSFASAHFVRLGSWFSPLLGFRFCLGFCSVASGFGFSDGSAVASPGRRGSETRAEAKRTFLEHLATGLSVKDALRATDRSVTTYEEWRREDPEFRDAVGRVRSMRQSGSSVRGEVMSFPEFSERFLNARVFAHMGNVVDLIEGRAPSWVHPAMTFDAGERDLVMVNMPPEHAKTTSITINYSVYRICMDPNVRILLVSKTADMARKMLYAIKTRLTHPAYADMISRYAPMGGFDKDSEAWNQNMIYVSDNARDSGEKDPTVQAIGIRGHVYGARADLVIMDDCIDLSNAHEYEKQIDWLQSEVISRISSTGALLVVGTRLASKDMYSELRDPHRYPDEVSPWSYLAMPAVLAFADRAEQWETLWPRSNQPEPGVKGDAVTPDEDGLFPKWDGTRLSKKRSRVSARAWAMVYMQKQVADDAAFNTDAVKAAINGNRMTGLIPKGMVNCRPAGMDGLTIVAGLDPATAGHTAAVVIGLDVMNGKRYVLDMFNKPSTSPESMRNLIKDWTDKYGIAEWRIEKNGFQGFLVHDREINDYCAARGTVIRPHFTGSNKHDADFGVASMTVLFNGHADKQQLIELPSTSFSEAAKSLVEQLVTWAPALPKNTKTDLVMALWFAELACRDRVMMNGNFTRSHQKNPFLTPWDKSRQVTVNMMELEAQRAFRPIGA